MMETQSPRSRARLYLLAVIILALAGFLRIEAVRKLPVDFDELVYLPTAFQYEKTMAAGNWKDIPFQENMEHPPLNKLLFAMDLLLRRPAEPAWDSLEVGRPISDQDRPAFDGPRKISMVGGTLQVLLTALVNPAGGFLLALDTYHTKYSAQVYLEGVPGLMAVLAVFLFEIGCAARKPENEPAEQQLRWPVLWLSAASLGLSAAGKYLYGAVGFVLLAFLIRRTRSVKPALLYALAALVVFLLADPFLWPNPPARLWESLTYHWRYAHSEHVVSSGMPWYSPIMFLVRSAPTHWHPGVFLTGWADVLLIPLTLIGLRRAWRERPVWLAWAAFGIILLLLWPTKWPQYTLLVRPPLAVCAGIGIGTVTHWLWRRVAKEKSGNGAEKPSL